MTQPPALGTGSRLAFMAPLSTARADRLAAGLAAYQPATVLDLGCGWGELLLRILASAPTATGIGVDTYGPDIDRGRAAAEARGLASRVIFIEGSASEHTEPADLVLNVGAFHAFGTIPDALVRLHGLVRPGGRLLFAADFWETVPGPECLAHMWPGTSADDCMELPDLVDLTVTAGFRPLGVAVANRDEWDEFESGLATDVEEWLLAHPGHPEAGELWATLDTQRAIWLRGHRGYMGFAYLTLGVPTA